MPSSKIGIVIALDGEREFSQGMKNAQKSAKLAEQGIKNLSKEFEGQANSLEALTKKQEALKSKQEALTRAVNMAKGGLANARKNYREAGQAVEKYSKELDEAQKELKQMEAAGKKGTAEYKKQEKAVEQLSKKLDQQTNEYQKADGAITDWETKLSKADGELKQTNKALDKNSQYMDEAKSSANGAATSIDAFGKEVKDATQSTDEMNISLSSMVKNKLVDLGADVLRDLGRAAVEGVKKVIEVGSQFEATMSKVQALSGASAGEMAQMEAKAKALGSSTKFSASQVGEAFSYMALAGYSASESIAAIDGVVNLAAASDMDLAAASDLVTDYLSAFGLQASDAAKLVDELAYAQANSNTTTEQLGAAYANCAVNAHANGQSVEDVTAILEGFANQGLKGERAGTALNSMMSDMVKNMKDGKIQIGETAVAVTDSEGNFRNLTDILYDVEQATAGMSEQQKAEALSAVFQRRSLLGVNTALSEGMTNIQGYKKDLEGCDGAASDMAKTMQDNLAGKVTEMNSALEGLGIALFEYFSGPLTGAVEIATGIISGITTLISPQKTEMEKFIDDTKQMNEQVAASIKTANDTIADGESKAAEIGLIGEQIGSILDSCDEYNQITLEDGTTAIVDANGKVIASFSEIDGSVSTTNGSLSEFAKDGLNTDLIVQDAMTAEGAIGYIETAAGTAEDKLADFAADGINTEGVESGKTAIVELFDEAGASVGTFETKVSGSGDIDIPVDGKGIDTGTKAIITCFDESTGAVESFEGKVGDLNNLNVDTLSQNFERLGSSTETVYHITDAFTRTKISNYVQTVGQYVSGLSDAWDETTGTLTASREELELWFSTASQKARYDAIQQAMSGLYATWGDAAVGMAQAQSVHKAALDAVEAATGKHFDSVQELNDAYMQATETRYTDAEAMEFYNAVTQDMINAVGDAEIEVGKASENLDNCESSIRSAEEQLSNFNETAEDTGQAAGDAADGTENVAQSAETVKTALGTVIDTTKLTAEELENLDETIDGMDAASMQAIAAAAESSASRITSAFESARETVKSAFNINPFEGWEQNQENGMDKMLEALNSQINGMTNYATNLETVSQHVGQEISPQFMKYLQDMGTEGAQVMQELAQAFENNDAEKISEIVGSYADAMDVQDRIANIMALNDVAIQLGLGQLGSSMEEWDSLSSVATSAIDGLGADVQSELTSSFADAVSTAQAAGVEIPDGLAEGIENAENPEEAVRSAIAQINAAINGQGQALVKAAKSVGVEVPNNIASEIAKGGPAAQAAITQLIGLIANADTSGASQLGSKVSSEVSAGVESSSDDVSSSAEGVVEGAVEAADGAAEDMQTAGQTSGTAFVMGVAAQQELAGAATQAMVNGAKAAADSAALQFNSSGVTAGSNFASGVSSQVGSAAGAGGSLGSSAYNAASSYSNSMYSVGSNMGSGLANGIRSMSGVVSAAAAAVVRNAVAAAKAAGEIQSPSKKMKREVGLMLTKGLGLGIKAGAAETAEEATSMMNRTFYALQKWFVKNKKRVGDTGAVWAEDVAYAWQALGAKAAKRNFGIKTYETKKDSKGNVKKVNKDVTTYSQEVLRAAEAYLSNVQSAYDVSEKDTLKYWENVRKNLKRGTQAYYDATKKIKELRAEIGSAGVAEQLYDTASTYYDMSAKAEMDYWNLVRKQYAKGTENRLQADKQYLAAKKKYTTDLKALEADYLADRKKITDELKKDTADRKEDLAKDIKRVNEDLARDIKSLESDLARETKSIQDQLARDLKSINDTLAKDIESANKRYSDAVATRQKELLNSYGLFDAFESKSATGSELLFNLQSQVAGFKDWQAELKKLSSRGILSKDLISELTAQGPQSSAAIHALSMLSNADLKAYNTAYQEKQAFAQQQAIDENKALRAEVNADIQSLKDTATSERTALKNTASAEISALKAQFNKDVTALKNQASADIKALKTQSSKDIDALKKQANADLKALSKTYTAERKNMTASLDKGVEKLAKSVSKTASDQVTRLVSALGTKKVSTSTATKKGNASGTRALGTNFAWMNENGEIEALVRRSDGAMLNTYAKAGDAIIPAANVGNLYDWSMISPAALAKQQAALQAYMQQVTASVSMAALNARLSSNYDQVSAQSPGYDDTSMLGLMRQMVALLEQGKEIYLDTGALVGGTSDAMSNNFAMRARRRRG